jgi:hypothetical protein
VAVARPIEPLVVDCSVIVKWELPANQRIYDCFYVALAEREGVNFWTGDERLYNALATHLPFIRFIADYKPLR